MRFYLVSVMEQWSQRVLIEAESPKQAIERVREGDGEYLNNSLEHVSTLDTETWSVEESDV